MKNKRILVLIAIIVVILGIKYANTPSEEILAARAVRAFNRNDTKQAEEYLEKAFEMGYKDSQKRNLYVNSIINSPLDVEAQERLVKFLDYPVDDASKLKVEYFLNDFKKEIHKKYPDNYIKQTVFNQKVLRWGKLPITYGFENSEGVPEYFTKEIENAFTQWEKATDHQLLFSKENKNPNIIIKFNSHNPADSEVKKYVVAYTAPAVSINSLKNMQINFYLKDPSGEYFSANQVYNTALHEIVHALGFMGHSNNKDHIMYLTKDSMSVMKDLREELTTADINTVKLLYKIKPDITNEPAAKSEYIPYLILGTDKEVNNAKIREAKIYIKKAPLLPAGYIDLAEGYVAAKNYSKAIKSLEKALELADTEEVRGMVYYNLAVAYHFIDHQELAEDNLRKAMAIKETDEQHYLLAEICLKQNKTSKAIEEYNRLIKNNPKNIEYVISLANIYVTKHKYMSARKVLKDFIQKNPSERNNKRLEPYGIIKAFL